jgi:hypothetical protein
MPKSGSVGAVGTQAAHRTRGILRHLSIELDGLRVEYDGLLKKHKDITLPEPLLCSPRLDARGWPMHDLKTGEMLFDALTGEPLNEEQQRAVDLRTDLLCLRSPFEKVHWYPKSARPIQQTMDGWRNRLFDVLRQFDTVEVRSALGGANPVHDLPLCTRPNLQEDEVLKAFHTHIHAVKHFLTQLSAAEGLAEQLQWAKRKNKHTDKEAAHACGLPLNTFRPIKNGRRSPSDANLDGILTYVSDTKKKFPESD